MAAYLTESATRDAIWYEATPTQQGLWILDRIDRLRPTYLLPTVLEFTGPVDHEPLRDAVARTLARHPALRSRFRLDLADRRVLYHTDGSPAEADLLDAAAEGWTAGQLRRVVELLCYTPFDLGTEAPARAAVIRVDQATTLLVLTVHHIVFDGVSRQLVIDEIADRYRAATQGRLPELSDPAHPATVLSTLPREELAERLEPVLERLRGAPTTVPLPYDGDPADPEQSMLGAMLETTFEAGVTGRILAAAEAAAGTPFMAGVAILAGTLARLTGQRDFLFAVVWPGRDTPESIDVVGMFMTTLVLRITIDENTTWRTLLTASRQSAMATFIDSDVPLDAIAAALDPHRDVSRPPLTPILVNMAESAEEFQLTPDIHARFCALSPQYSKWDLALFVGVSARADQPRLTLALDYPEALFARTTVIDLLAALRRSAAALADAPEDIVLEPDLTDTATAGDLADPAARLSLVRAIWCEVLDTADVAEDVSFFDAGGDSLRLVILVERLSQAAGRPLRTVDLFRAGTVRGQAELLAAPLEPAAAAPAGSRSRLLDSIRSGRLDEAEQPR